MAVLFAPEPTGTTFILGAIAGAIGGSMVQVGICYEGCQRGRVRAA
jgi:uncharacterized membrane protein